jgi:hypothetical protein
LCPTNSSTPTDTQLRQTDRGQPTDPPQQQLYKNTFNARKKNYILSSHALVDDDCDDDDCDDDDALK